MAVVDAHIQAFIIYLILPIFMVYLVMLYVFNMTLMILKNKIEAWLIYQACSRFHSRFCKHDKLILFRSIEDLKKKMNVTNLRILELGIGSGQNFCNYPSGSNITGLDPNPENEKYVKRNIETPAAKRNHIKLDKFITGYAESMPEAVSNYFDAVVCTCVMCTVQDPEAVIEEVHRVLKPGGVFFFLEHVAGEEGTMIRRIQNLLQIFWPHLCAHCNINRETWAFLDRSSFKDVEYRRYSISTWIFFFLRPFMYGTATKNV